jgi:hypothetical protein
MIVLVCGDRWWKDREKIKARLSTLPKDTTILHGACRGADLIAASVAQELGMKVKAFPADWDRYGSSAGPIRNRLMLDERPDLVIAFHSDLSNSKGTADTVTEARSRKIETEVTP